MRKRILFFKTLTDRIVRNNRGRFLLVLSAFCGLIVFNLLLSDYLVYPGKVVFSGLFGFIIVASQLGLAYLFGVNRGIWKYSSISDLILIVKVAAVSFALNIVSMLVTGLGHDALRILLVDHMLFVLSFGGLRLLVRLYRNVGPVPSTLKRVLIVGAGDGGDIACRRVKHDTTQYEVVGFLDDDPWKKNHEIHGVKVLGATHQIVEIVQANEVNEVVIAIPSAGPALLRSLAEKCFEAKAQVKIMPSLSELSENSATFEIRNLKLEDLLAREPIIEDLSSVRKTYVNKRVLVTGAAGSIGEELVKQVAQMGPAIVYLLDQAESPLYFLFRECQVKFPNVEFVPMLCDITDHWALGRFFKQAQPQIVLHAAAYKHVPILEDNIYQAIS
ncbi:MAG TPA: SDR family NAD(P)-dependent oxidoreductase, partial [bacterium]|nr:SDR family NAD(P)-dependent oxidoreductase [bacterium]